MLWYMSTGAWGHHCVVTSGLVCGPWELQRARGGEGNSLGDEGSYNNAMRAMIAHSSHVIIISIVGQDGGEGKVRWSQ